MTERRQTLSILQYNVNNSRLKTMVPLLEDSGISEFDILAIQEPWKNNYAPTTYNPARAGFYLVYRPGGDTRVCFYINNRIPTEDWEASFPTPDISIVRIWVLAGEEPARRRRITIYNVYNPSPLSFTTTTSPAVSELGNILRADTGEKIIVGDFNMHHPAWCGPSRPTQHAAADQLIDVAGEANVTLITARGAVTWERGQHSSTIDLTFMSTTLEEHLECCKVRRDLMQASDHLPIATKINMRTDTVATEPRRAWKTMDPEEFAQEVSRQVPAGRRLNSREDIDLRVDEITAAIQRSIEKTVPWSRPSPRARSFWNGRCDAVTKEARRQRRAWQESRSLEDWEALKSAYARKKKVIQKAKTLDFRRGIHEASQSPEGIWRLARWAKDKSHLPQELPQFPALVKEGGMADTFETKVEVLKEKFFPPPQAADLGDINDAEYPARVDSPCGITVEEVEQAIRRCHADKAPGPDKIPNRALQAALPVLSEHLTVLFQACIEKGYHPKAFKKANTITLKKPGKDDYTEAKAYRPIALINTLGKALEKIIGTKLSALAELHKLVPEAQMGARKGRATDTALELITEQVHTVWKKGSGWVVSLLSLDVAGAFDYASHPRLLHNLRKRRVPEWIVLWVKSFLEDRTSTLTINRRSSGVFPVPNGIPQGSPISPILYLFFNADLLDACNQTRYRASATGFADDVNIITYGTSTEENCKALSRIHDECTTWARRHGSSFAPKKYELIHMTRKPRRFDMTASINIGPDIVTPKSDIRILGVQIDTHLRWGPHVRRIQEKMTRQTQALNRTSASTWGATLARSRQIYAAVIRPAITYGATVWYTPSDAPGHRKGLTKKLEVIQNKALRVVSGTFKTTPVRFLENETSTPPIRLHLDELQAGARLRLTRGDGGKIVESACEKIRNRLRGTRGRRARVVKTPGMEKKEWLQQILQSDINAQHGCITSDAPITENRAPGDTAKTFLRNNFRKRWEREWLEYSHGADPRTEPARSAVCEKKDTLRRHEGLTKAESSLAIQLRTGRVGLADYLYKRRVPGFESPACSCGWGRQTIHHVIMFCPTWAIDRRWMLTAAGSNDVGQILTTNKGLRAVTRWLIISGVLGQFSLAREQLSDEA